MFLQFGTSKKAFTSILFSHPKKRRLLVLPWFLYLKAAVKITKVNINPLYLLGKWDVKERIF